MSKFMSPRFVLSLIVLSLTIVWDRMLGSNVVSHVLAAGALLPVVSTFPDLTIAKGSKAKNFYPGSTLKAMQAQKTSEVMVSDKDVANEIVNLVRADVEGIKYNVILGQYYREFRGWNTETQAAHIDMLYKVRGLETPDKAELAKQTMQQNHIVALYCEWPELLTWTKDSVSNSRAAKRYTRAMADYDEHVEEIQQKQLAETATKLVESGEVTEDKVKELLKANPDMSADDLTDAIENASFKTLTVATANETPKVKYVTRLKDFVTGYIGEIANKAEYNRFMEIVGKLGVNPEKFDEWAKEARKANPLLKSTKTSDKSADDAA